MLKKYVLDLVVGQEFFLASDAPNLNHDFYNTTWVVINYHPRGVYARPFDQNAKTVCYEYWPTGVSEKGVFFMLDTICYVKSLQQISDALKAISVL
jgi:hypothetical protein